MIKFDNSRSSSCRAYDGEVFSNTLYFEAKLGWKGLLVEANPDSFSELKAKNRKSFLLGHCISLNPMVEVIDFDAAGLIGGIIRVKTFDEF
jgi:hypothetical protein